MISDGTHEEQHVPHKMSNREYTTRHDILDKEIAFASEEFDARLERIRAPMADKDIDVLFVSAPEGLYYESGFLSEWYQAQSPAIWPPASGIAIHRDSARTIHFETEMEEVLVQYTTVSPDIRIHRDSARAMIEFITDELKSASWLSGTVGLEIFSYRPNRGHSERFEAALVRAGAKVVDGTSVLRDVRRIKSPQELAYLREAGRFADIGMQAARNALKVGVTELDVHAEMTYAMLKAGGEPAAIYLPVASGKKSVASHGLVSHKKIRSGEVVVIDICGVCERYHTNIARTVHMGEPPRSVASQVEKSTAVFEEIAPTLSPGMRVADLTKFVQDYYRQHEIWDDRGWVGGYELGNALPPDWDGPFTYDVDTNPGDATLDAGMVVNLESDVYLPEGAGAALVINTLEFSNDSVSYLNDFPVALSVVG